MDNIKKIAFVREINQNTGKEEIVRVVIFSNTNKPVIEKYDKSKHLSLLLNYAKTNSLEVKRGIISEAVKTGFVMVADSENVQEMDNLRKEIEEESKLHSEKDILEDDIVEYSKKVEPEQKTVVKKELSKEFLELQEYLKLSHARTSGNLSSEQKRRLAELTLIHNDRIDAIEASYIQKEAGRISNDSYLKVRKNHYDELIKALRNANGEESINAENDRGMSLTRRPLVPNKNNDNDEKNNNNDVKEEKDDKPDSNDKSGSNESLRLGPGTDEVLHLGPGEQDKKPEEDIDAKKGEKDNRPVAEGVIHLGPDVPEHPTIEPEAPITRYGLPILRPGEERISYTRALQILKAYKVLQDNDIPVNFGDELVRAVASLVDNPSKVGPIGNLTTGFIPSDKQEAAAEHDLAILNARIKNGEVLTDKEKNRYIECVYTLSGIQDVLEDDLITKHDGYSLRNPGERTIKVDPPKKGDEAPVPAYLPTGTDKEDDKPDKTDESKKDGEPDKTDESKKDGEPDKTDEPKKDGEPDKTDEPKKDGESDKTDEPKKDGESDKTDEPKKDGEPDKTDEPKKDGEPDKTDEPKKDGKPDKDDDGAIDVDSSEKEPETGKKKGIVRRALTWLLAGVLGVTGLHFIVNWIRGRNDYSKRVKTEEKKIEHVATPTPKPTETPPGKEDKPKDRTTSDALSKQDTLNLVEDYARTHSIDASTYHFLQENAEFLKQFNNIKQFEYVCDALSFGYNMNANTRNLNNFKLNGETVSLQSFTRDFLCAKAVINGYSAEEMVNIFGQSMSYDEIMNGYHNFMNMMATYGTNATMRPPFELLIDNPSDLSNMNSLFEKLAKINQSRVDGTLTSSETDAFIVAVDKLFVQGTGFSNEATKTLASSFVDSFVFIQSNLGEGEALLVHQDGSGVKVGTGFEQSRDGLTLTHPDGTVYKFYKLYNNAENVDNPCYVEQQKLQRDIHSMGSLAGDSSLRYSLADEFEKSGVDEVIVAKVRTGNYTHDDLVRVGTEIPSLSDKISDFETALSRGEDTRVPFNTVCSRVDELLGVKEENHISRVMGTLVNARRAEASYTDYVINGAHFYTNPSDSIIEGKERVEEVHTEHIETPAEKALREAREREARRADEVEEDALREAAEIFEDRSRIPEESTPTPEPTEKPTPVVTEVPTATVKVTETPTIDPVRSEEEALRIAAEEASKRETPTPVVTEAPTPEPTEIPTPVVTVDPVRSEEEALRIAAEEANKRETPTPVVTEAPTPEPTEEDEYEYTWVPQEGYDSEVDKTRKAPGEKPTPVVTVKPTPEPTETPTPVVTVKPTETPTQETEYEYTWVPQKDYDPEVDKTRTAPGEKPYSGEFSEDMYQRALEDMSDEELTGGRSLSRRL